MRTEVLFFKTLFFVFLSFYIASYIIFLILVICIEYRTTTNFVESSRIVLFAPSLLGLAAIIFFSPVLLFICFIQWWVQSNKLKNLTSFLLVIAYGFLIFKFPGFRFDNTSFYDVVDETFAYLLLSIPSTLLFLVLLFYLTQCKKRKI